MNKDTTGNATLAMGSRDVLTQILRNGACQMLTQAVENEVAEYLAEHAGERDSSGHRRVVRNGHAEPRQLMTGVGPIDIKRPRINDKRTDEQGQRIRFTSKILPPYLRRTQSLDELLSERNQHWQLQRGP